MSGKGKGKQRATPPLEEDNGELLDRVNTEDDDYTDGEDESHAEHSYESQRQRRIRENQLLLTSLGISSSITQSSAPPAVRRTTSRSNVTPNKKRRAVYDRSGYIVSKPQGYERHTLAAVEIPPDRQLRRRIQGGEFQDCSSWAEGEDRRWRFGLGRGGRLKGDEPEEMGGVDASFRWRIWKGLEKELRKEMKKRGELNEIDQRPVGPEPAEASRSAYSLLPGDTCHQCRRKSEKLKMRCRNVDPLCRASFCETCCKRYSYFDFEPESRSFICPLCKDCCNCSNCIRKRDLGHLLPAVGKGGRTKSLMHTVRAQGCEGMTVQAWIEKTTEERVGIPFDRVRLVDHELDVITPYCPELEDSKPEPAAVKKKKQGGAKGTKRKRKGEKDEKDDETENAAKAPVVLKFKIPQIATKERVKDVDSDGDTIGDGSGDESDDSGLTPLSDSLSPVPPRLAFPPRPATELWNTMKPAPAVMLPLASPPNMVLPLPPPEAVARSSLSPPSDTNTEGGKKRRKPPPKANIIRAPKHSASHQDSPVVLPSLSWQIPSNLPNGQMWMDKQQELLYSSFQPHTLPYSHPPFQQPIDVSLGPAQLDTSKLDL